MKVLHSLVEDNEGLKRDNAEMHRLLAESREDYHILQDELEEQRANSPSRGKISICAWELASDIGAFSGDASPEIAVSHSWKYYITKETQYQHREVLPQLCEFPVFLLTT